MIRVQFKHDVLDPTWGKPVDLGYPDRAALPENLENLAGEVYVRAMDWADAMEYNRNYVGFQILRNDGCVIYTYDSADSTQKRRTELLQFCTKS